MARLAAAGQGVGGGVVLLAALLILVLGAVFGLRWRRLVDFGGRDGGVRDVGAPGRRGATSGLFEDDGDEDPDSAYVGHAILAPVGPGHARGSVTFSTAAGALRIRAVVEHAEPGDHELTLQADPHCPAPGRAAAGQGEPRGAGASTTPAAHRLADLGRLVVGQDGRGDLLLYLHPSAYRQEQRAGWRMIVGKTVLLGGLVGEPAACGVVVHQGGGPHH